MIKILYFDTSVLIKYFIQEKGSNLIKWIVDNRCKQSIILLASQIGDFELRKILKKKRDNKKISKEQFEKINMTLKSSPREIIPTDIKRIGKVVNYLTLTIKSEGDNLKQHI